MGNFEESKINWEIKCKSVHPDDELLFMKKKNWLSTSYSKYFQCHKTIFLDFCHLYSYLLL